MCALLVAISDARGARRHEATIENPVRIERMHPMTNEAIVVRDEHEEIPPPPVRGRHMAPLEGERRLMLAVLERAVDDFRTYADIPTARGRWLFREVSAWFGSPEAGPFDFEGICQATGLDPDFIRKGLRGKDSAPLPRRHDVSGGNCSTSASMPTGGAGSTTGDSTHDCR
jgi:hypothetical protein